MMRDALWFGLYTGMRLREVLRLHWERVDREESVFRVDETKTGAPLELPMTRQLAAIFERRWADSGELPAGWVFPSPARSDIPLSNLGHLYADITEAGARSSGTTRVATASSPSLSARVWVWYGKSKSLI